MKTIEEYCIHLQKTQTQDVETSVSQPLTETEQSNLIQNAQENFHQVKHFAAIVKNQVRNTIAKNDPTVKALHRFSSPNEEESLLPTIPLSITENLIPSTQAELIQNLSNLFQADTGVCQTYFNSVEPISRSISEAYL